MGVKKLTALLERFAPACFTTPAAKDIRGWRVSIDSNIYIHRFFRGPDTRYADPERRHLHGIHRMAMFMKSADITPVFVFDNAEPAECKMNELSRREFARMVVSRELDSELERATRVKIYKSIASSCLGDRRIGNGVDSFDYAKDASLFGVSLPLDFDTRTNSTRADELASAMHAGNLSQSSLRALAADFLLVTTARLQGLVLNRASKPTIESRLSALELDVCAGLQQLLEDQATVSNEDAAETMHNLSRFSALSDERLSTLQRRSEPLTERHIMECQMLVSALGFATYTVSSGMESEAVCASLDAAGIVDATCSEDLDVLPFGGRRLLRNFSSLGGQMVLIDSARALSDLQLTREAFIDLCILCGTDFSSTLKNVGPITALKLIRQYGSIENILDTGKYEPRELFHYELARSIFARDVKLPFSSRDELRPGKSSPEVLDSLLPTRDDDYVLGDTQSGSSDPFAQNIVF
ncbi:hypothetical protein H4R99_003834 [Coemansia sp. RSA 1722]|nr:hypothetical protein IWW45_000854 [Coemansia sp. RSA 485]KAJ2599126.1 hypothetical protein H4R99_003834 [Coemansia sp. RSA 1722]